MTSAASRSHILHQPPSTPAAAPLSALLATGLLDTPPEEAFDRLTRLAATVAGAPLALISLMDGTRQFIKSATGIVAGGSFSLDDWPCPLVARAAEPLAIDDSAADRRLAPLPAVRRHGIRAYAGVPLTSSDGHVIGVLGVATSTPHRWELPVMAVLQDIAAAVMSEIDLRAAASDAHRAILREHTARATAEAAELRYRALVDGLDAIVWEADARTLQLSFVSERSRAILGYAPARWTTNRGFWKRIIHPDDRAATVAQWRAAAAGSDERELEYRVRAADGHLVWMRNHMRRQPGEGGCPPVLRGIMVDVTAQHQAEAEREHLRQEALRRAHEEQMLLEVSAALNAAVTEPEVVRVLAEQAIRLCDADGAGVGLLHAGALMVTELNQSRWSERTYTPSPTSSIAGHVLLSGRPYRTNDLTTDPHTDRAIDEERGIRAQIVAPITGAGGRSLGLLTVLNKRGGGPFTEQDEALLAGLGALAAIALERARTGASLAAAAEALRASESRFRSLVQNASDITMVLTPDGVLRYVTPAIARLLGYQPHELLALPPLTWIHEDDRAAARLVLRRQADGTAPGLQPHIFRVRHAGGGWRDMEGLIANLLHEPSVGGLVLTMRDVTERRQMEARLARQALSDALTGLPNRALFTDRLGHALARAPEPNADIAVVLLDLDGFKFVNDSLGHTTGDRLLMAVARRLMGCLRAGDTLCRFGGDEFALLLENAGGVAGALAVAQRALEVLLRPVQLAEREVFVTASVGVTLARLQDRSTVEDLLREADIALYQAKEAGKSRVAVFNPGMDERAVQRLDLETDLRRALEREELVLHYQLETDLRTDRIAGVEALVRWNHPQRGLVPPAMFVPLAEETGLILPIGRWVLREACQQARAWRKHIPLVMSVNLSARQFTEPDLVQMITDVLTESGLEPEALKLEITETTIMQENGSAVASLRALTALGVQIAIDDFGTGYSSLSYLRRFPVDTLKIDRSFIRELGSDPATAAIVEAIVGVAHTLSMDVTAEGIETADQLARARGLGCDLGQGYHIGPPVPAAAITKLLLPPTGDAGAAA